MLGIRIPETVVEAELDFDAFVLDATNVMKNATLVPVPHPKTGEPLDVVEIVCDGVQDAICSLKLLCMFRGFDYTANIVSFDLLVFIFVPVVWLMFRVVNHG